MKLNELQIGSTATILSVGGEGALRQHFLDMGLIQGTEVTVVQYAPMGDPIELRLHGYELTIRLKDAKNIENSMELAADTLFAFADKGLDSAVRAARKAS